MNASAGAPLISVLVPTYRRRALLERNLECCATALSGVAESFEVLVGDNAGEAGVEGLVCAWAERTGIGARYWGDPTPTMQANHQRLLAEARGNWVVVVHDDDFLLPGAGRVLVESAMAGGTDPLPVRHAVVLVDGNGRRQRVEGQGRDEVLKPVDAVRALITHSNFVRMPGMLLPAAALRQAGGFDQSSGLFFDWATWLALCSGRGLRLASRPVAAYSRHAGTDTEQKMFVSEVAEGLAGLLERHAMAAGLAEAEIRQRVGRFVWRFGLAGAWRAARAGRADELRRRVALWSRAPFDRLPCPWSWLGLRLGFSVLAIMLRRN